MPINKQIPGMHQSVRAALYKFKSDEKIIMNKLSREWFITRADEVWIGKDKEVSSKYRYALLKPTFTYQEMFNLDREVIAIFCDYEYFQPRTLDAIDVVAKKFQSLRIEKVCSIILSSCDNVETKIRDLLKSDEESQVIIPIPYSEYIQTNDGYYLRNKFKANFYSRDLFAFEGPLRKDLYFFGRTDLLHKIVSRHNSNENSGLFGLRKSGKTSVIFGVERALAANNALSILVDCQDTGFNQRRWNEALWYILHQLYKKYKFNEELTNESEFSEKNASIIFESELLNLHKKFGKTNILIIFDEIENITPSVSATAHWDNDLDFVLFWQTLRSLYQRNPNIFSYLIVGTNPLCIEQPKIQDKANPLFMSLPFEFIEPFDVDRTREMIGKLGRIMGLKFDQLIFSKLTEDYGGHPFLMRHVCSVMNTYLKSERPVDIGRIQYQQAKLEFDEKYGKYIQMVLEVLETHYPDEYSMLVFLALNEIELFKSFAADSPNYTNHLIGYGLINNKNGEYDFRIDAIKKYLIIKNQYKKIATTQEEMWSEISHRRNNIEPKLRKIIRNQLMSYLGEKESRDYVLKIMGENKSSRYGGLAYKDLFDPNKCEIYWEDLRKISISRWDIFKHIFGQDQERFNLEMRSVNRLRSDAHSSTLTEEEMAHFRVSISRLEKLVEDFLD
jgi:hypothetical protein